MRKPIIAANWKMNMPPKEAEQFLNAFLGELGDLTEVADVVIAPPFVSIPLALEKASGSRVGIAAQNVSDQDNGAFTGEVSTSMLQGMGVQYVIIGHSERRMLYGESNQIINAKIKKALSADLVPIFCIGETLEERDAGKLETVLCEQITQGLDGISENDVKKIVTAYEPVWAIGTGRTASAEQAQDAHAFVRSVLAELYSNQVAETIRIQYGGSMKAANAAELIAQPDIDGGLVGGASLEAQSFLDLIRAATA